MTDNIKQITTSPNTINGPVIGTPAASVLSPAVPAPKVRHSCECECDSCAKSSCKCSSLSPCPLTDVLDVIGGKWKIPLLCALSCSPATRYNELKRKIPYITNTMLANSLRELEEAGLVLRRQYAEMPVRVEYSLTGVGESLIPILFSLQAWSITHLPGRTK